MAPQLQLEEATVERHRLVDRADLVKEYPGESPVYVSLETSLGPKTLALGPKHRVAIDSDFLTDARLRLGVEAVL